MLGLACVIHYYMGFLLVLSQHHLVTTPTAIPVRYLTQDGAGLLYLISAVLATWALVYPGWYGALATVPQQCVLYAATWSTVTATLSGRYPDGVERFWEFISIDHIGTALFSVAHLVSLVAYHGTRWKPRA